MCFFASMRVSSNGLHGRQTYAKVIPLVLKRSQQYSAATNLNINAEDAEGAGKCQMISEKQGVVAIRFSRLKPVPINSHA